MLTDIIHRVAQMVPRWSGLRALGQSRVLGLSILVPFIGAIILFNQQLVTLLTVTPAALGLDPTDPNSMAAAEVVSLNRLYLYYFGLCALGIGSFLFSMVCPELIKRYATLTESVEVEGAIVTPPTARLLMREVVVDHELIWRDDESRVPRFLRDVYYPYEAEALFDEVMREAGNELELQEEGVEPGEGFHFAHGELNLDKLLGVVLDARLPERSLRALFLAKGFGRKVELLTLRYLAMDHSRLVTRALISSLYGIGFVTLLVPTVTTFGVILSHTLGF